MKKITKKDFVNMSSASIDKLKNPGLREILRGARQLYTQQEAKFSEYSSTIYSPALDKMQDYYEENGKKAISRMRRKELTNEIYRLQEFFEAKSSTIPGVRKIQKEQDERIFGIDEKTNKPRHRMTIQQREDFWSAYDEFVSMQKASYIRNMGSDVVQQYLGQIMIEAEKTRGGGFEFSVGTFQELKRRLEEEREKEDWEMSGYEYTDDDVHSGKRPY